MKKNESDCRIYCFILTYLYCMILRDMPVAHNKQRYTIEEYLEMENESIHKHEYHLGEMYAIADNTFAHNIVTSNLMGELSLKLKGKKCRPFGSDLRLHIERNTLFTYPDITVVCGDLKGLNDDKINCINPTILIEVLSPGTRQYDMNGKFKLYRDIPTLKEYVLVEPESVSVIIYRKNNIFAWQQQKYLSLDDVLELLSIQVALTMKEIYEGIHL